MDQLIKATAGDVRIYAAVTTDLVSEGAKRHQCSALAAAALGRTMTGALLMAANLKNQEAVTLSFNGNGPLGRVVADANNNGFVRGYVQHPEVELPLTNGKLSVGQGIGCGLLNVTRFTGIGDPQSGSVEILSGEVAEDLTRYLFYSEQTPSAVSLGVLVGTDLSVLAAGGFIVQPLPEAGDDTIGRLEGNIAELKPVSQLVKDGIGPKEIIAAVLQGFGEVEYLSATDLAFKCQCSRVRTEDMLVALAPSDRKSLIDDGQAEVCCSFCGEKYQFSREDLIIIDNVAKKLADMRAKKGKN